MVRAAGRARNVQIRYPLPRFDKKPKIPKKVRPLEMMTRGEWAAIPRIPLDSDVRLKLPIWHIRYTFTDTDECHSPEECIPFLRNLQTEWQEKGFPDLMYNFLISSDGMLYEGRGFDWKCTVFQDPWVNTKGESLNVAYIGSFHNVEAPWQFRLTSKYLEKWMFRHGLLEERFEITPSICWPEDFDPPGETASPEVLLDTGANIPAEMPPQMPIPSHEFFKRSVASEESSLSDGLEGEDLIEIPEGGLVV